MDIKDIAEQSPAWIFWYWMNEREQIYYNKVAGMPKPWTDDSIFQKFKFTNVFRRHDAVTKHYIRWISELLPLSVKPSDSVGPLVVWNTTMYRLFNWPNTLDAIGIIKTSGDIECAYKVCEELFSSGEKLFTSAYMITNAASHDPKYKLVLDRMKSWFTSAPRIYQEIVGDNTMEHAVYVLKKLPMIGPFIAYEIACDLAYTQILCNATDQTTWANPGPGAARGLNRIYHREVKAKVPKDQLIREMRWLFDARADNLDVHFDPDTMTMREIEHSLCEFDKYMRVLLGEGYPKSNYPGLPEVQ